ncbi:Aste57867_11646 [Aphanomyces stellatus]|uniref:Aste57867_11646 protein n=1 Tax=Aphanomyces stellatus TaxID=120398 RepID=A0A485KTW5_9STRA|nr:hypothetical protein As57867_011603 [Aphanomyces stellatus]VFT88504.1 Aste57867_11646 [Aphanomyces stellatus]
MAKGSTKGGGNAGANNAKEMKMFLKNRMWKDHWQVLVGVSAVVVALFAYFFLQHANSEQSIQLIHLSNKVDVDRVFRSGEPWIVLCSKEDSVLPEVFDKASKRLSSKINVGVVDCNGRLPSGKTVYNKFLIRDDIVPTVFTVANGEKPKQLFLNYLQKPKALASQALVQVKKTLHEVQNTKQLEDKCLGKSTSCVLIYRTGKKFDEYQKTWLQTVMERHRLVKFAWMDSSILSLSVESLLKKPATQNQHRLVVFKKVQSTDGNTTTLAKSYTSYFEQLAVEAFLDEHVAAKGDTDSFRPLTKPVTVKRRPKPTPATKQTDSQPKRTAEDIAELERQRRARMDEESQQFYPEEVDEPVDVAADIDDEDEDVVIDLDDL